MNNLIICPVGGPLTFDSRFDGANHWRYTDRLPRDYKTLAIQYGDYTPPDNTYDFILKKTGFKWTMAKELFNSIDLSQYDYIGFMDDDLVTDIQNLNGAFRIAIANSLKIFQLSLTEDSDAFYPILKQKPSTLFSRTNFIEIMGPIIHSSLLPLCLDLWNRYDIFSGWGFDKVICDLTQTPAAVIHKHSMVHPLRPSSYDKTKAFAEMDKLTIEVFPALMKERYGVDWKFNDKQVEFMSIPSTSINVFLDCGTHYGQGLNQFMQRFYMNDTWCIETFEANPVTYKKFKPHRPKFITAINAAVSDHDGVIPVYIETPPGEGDTGMGTSIISPDIWHPASSDNFKVTVDVPCIDFSRIIRSYRDTDNIIVKMDIEGAEYDVLEKLIADGTIHYINHLAVEWHSRCFSNPDIYIARENAIREALKKCNIILEEWA